MQGKIIANFGSNVLVKLSSGRKVKALFRSHLNSQLTVGDNVELKCTNSTYIVTKLLARKSLISRTNQHRRRTKNIAANVDIAVVVITHSPAPIEHYIDRYLAALHNNHIQPVIAINKIDIQNPKDKDHIKIFARIYKSIGYKIFYISAKENIGIDSLLNELKGKTSIFLGQSGVGKSETLNTILNKKVTQTNKLSSLTKKGCHTTTCSRLYEIDNTNIIDSPGIREFGLWHLSKEQLFDGFIDFKKYKGMCQFRNCAHQQNSKGCVIVKQLKKGNIQETRFKNYHRILNPMLV